MDPELTEEQILQLCTSPLYIFYSVASEYLEPARINRMQLIRALEYGLKSSNPFCDALFDFLKSNLHKLHERLPGVSDEDFSQQLETELLRTRETIGELSIGDLRIYSFKSALKDYARFVAEGSVFGRDFGGSAPMDRQADRIAALLG